MAREFTIWSVPKGRKTENMPFIGLDDAHVEFNERHPESFYDNLMEHVRDVTGCMDDFVKVPEECYDLIKNLVDNLDATKDYVLSLD